MRVVMLEAPQAMLDERRRLGQDKRDEVWDGVLYIVPPPGDAHQEFSYLFMKVVGPLAEARGLLPRSEPGLDRTETDHRVPDLAFASPEQRSERGLECAQLVGEIRSPRDQSYEKLDFYAQVGVQEVLILHPRPRRVELHRNVAGRMLPAWSSPGTAAAPGSDRFTKICALDR